MRQKCRPVWAAVARRRGALRVTFGTRQGCLPCLCHGTAAVDVRRRCAGCLASNGKADAARHERGTGRPPVSLSPCPPGCSRLALLPNAVRARGHSLTLCATSHPRCSLGAARAARRGPRPWRRRSAVYAGVQDCFAQKTAPSALLCLAQPDQKPKYDGHLSLSFSLFLVSPQNGRQPGGQSNMPTPRVPCLLGPWLAAAKKKRNTKRKRTATVHGPGIEPGSSHRRAPHAGYMWAITLEV